MSDLLPNNATEQERTLSLATTRLDEVAVLVRETWDPDTCPEQALPWLAWALSIDQWDVDWTAAQKRAAIKAAIAVQRTKGTIGAVRRSLRALDIEARVLEWHRQQSIGSEYTYKLFIEARDGSPVTSLEEIEGAIAVVDRTKSLRSHLHSVEVTAATEAGPMVAAVAGLGAEIVVEYSGGEVVVAEENIVVT